MYLFSLVPNINLWLWYFLVVFTCCFVPPLLMYLLTLVPKINLWLWYFLIVFTCWLLSPVLMYPFSLVPIPICDCGISLFPGRIHFFVLITPVSMYYFSLWCQISICDCGISWPYSRFALISPVSMYLFFSVPQINRWLWYFLAICTCYLDSSPHFGAKKQSVIVVSPGRIHLLFSFTGVNVLLLFGAEYQSVVAVYFLVEFTCCLVPPVLMYLFNLVPNINLWLWYFLFSRLTCFIVSLHFGAENQSVIVVFPGLIHFLFSLTRVNVSLLLVPNIKLWSRFFLLVCTCLILPVLMCLYHSKPLTLWWCS